MVVSVGKCVIDISALKQHDLIMTLLCIKICHVTQIYIHTYMYMLKIIIFGAKMGEINYRAILGLTTFISPFNISRMAEF